MHELIDRTARIARPPPTLRPRGCMGVTQVVMRDNSEVQEGRS